MAVVMELNTGDSLVIGKSIIRLDRKNGSRARLVIDSSENIERIKAGDRMPPSENGSEKPPTTFLRRPSPA